MRLIKEQLAELLKLDVPLTKKDDFDSFWTEAVDRVEKHDPHIKMELREYPLDGVKVYDSIFLGLDKTPVNSWIMLPVCASKDKPVPVVVWFHGGNGSRMRPFNYLHWIMAGFAVIAMDFRQQGGTTGSNTPLKRCGANSFAVMNIEDCKSYYLYHAWTDALISIKLSRLIPEIDADKIVVAGGSQGGGTALAMAALDKRIALCLAAVPSFCWWERRIFIRSACAADISRFIERYPEKTETVFNTMTYYDVVNFVDKIECPVMASCGMKDESTPPDCVYAAYNKIRSEKYMDNYPAGGHSIEPQTTENWLRFIRERLT